MESKGYYPTAKTFVLDAQDNLLILRRSIFVLYRRRSYDLPGGTIKRDELPLETAIRESREETGIVLDQPRMQEIGMFLGRTFFVCRLDEVQPPVHRSWEHGADMWLPFSDADQVLTHLPQARAWRFLHLNNHLLHPAEKAA